MKHLLQNERPTVSKDLVDFELAAFRQESSGAFVIIEMGIEAFGNLLNTIGNFMMLSYIGNVDKGRKEANDAMALINKLESKKDMINFVALRDLIVPVPEGFSGSFGEYAALLDNSREPSFKACNDFLSQFQIYASTFVSDKSTKLSNKSLENDFKILRKRRKAHEDEILTYFKSGNAQRAKLGSLFEYHMELVPGLRRAVRNWEASLKSNQLKTVQAYLDNLTKTMKLVEEIQNSAVGSEVSKNAFLNLAQGAREAAEEIEAIGKFFIRSEIASVSAGHIAERLLETTK